MFLVLRVVDVCMSDEQEVWSEVSVTGDGVAVTLYSRDGDGEPVVEDEFWQTHSELESGEQTTTVLTTGE